MMADTDTLHPVFLERLERALADYPGAYILSGGRSAARQAELYDDFLRGVGNPANPPGTSWHEYDETAPHPHATAEDAAATKLTGGVWTMAVDLAGFYGGIHVNAASYGLCFPIPTEYWHAQPIEITEPQRTAGAWRRLAAPPAPPVQPTDPYDARGRTVLHYTGE